MKYARMITLAVASLFLFNFSLPAEDVPVPAVSAPEHAPHTAVYKVPNLNDELSKGLVTGLAGVPGIISAKPDAAAGCVCVTFEPGKTGSEAILAELRKSAPAASLDSVGPADPKSSAKDCGKCPMHKSCTGSKG